jgi:hypothetical protein
MSRIASGEAIAAEAIFTFLFGLFSRLTAVVSWCAFSFVFWFEKFCFSSRGVCFGLKSISVVSHTLFAFLVMCM